MGIAKLYGQKASGADINGIIKDYHAYAGENVSAGDLVEYIKGIASQRTETSSDTAIDTTKNAGSTISAVLLDESRVFIACSMDTYVCLYGVVVTINGTKIAQGTITELNSTDYTGYTISAVLVEKDKVFIAHSSNMKTSSSNHLNGMVCTISGTTITAGSSTEISSNTYTGYSISATLLPDGNIFIAHSYGSSRYLYGTVCSISGTTITAGTTTSIYTTKQTGFSIATVVLDGARVFIAHSYETSYNLYAIVCTISGTTITKGSSTIVAGGSNYGYCVSAELLPNGNVFLAHSGAADHYLYGSICTISGTSITKGVTTLLVDGTYAGYVISTQLLPNGNIFVTHSHLSYLRLYGAVVVIDGTNITIGEDTLFNISQYAAQCVSSVLLPSGDVFVAHCYESSYYLYGQIWGVSNNVPTNNITVTEYETQVRKTATSKFDGIAKTSGVGGTTTTPKDYVSIYTL